MILAAATTIELPASPSVILTGLLALAVPVLIGAIKGLLDIILFFRAKPPHHEVYATKTEVMALEERLVALVDEQSGSSAQIEQRLGSRVSEIEGRIERQLTKMDSRLESISNQLSSQSGAIHELRGELHTRRLAS